MEKKIELGYTEIEKNKFYCNRTPIFLKDGDIDKVLVSNRISSGEKALNTLFFYFYNDQKVKPFYIIFPKTSAYIKSFDGQTKWLYCLIEDDDLLEKYNIIWDKVSADIKK